MAAVISSCHSLVLHEKKALQSPKHVRSSVRRIKNTSSRRRFHRTALVVRSKAVQSETQTVSDESLAESLSKQKLSLSGNQIKVRGEIRLRKKTLLDVTDFFSDILDDVADIFGRKVRLQLVSEEVDPGTGKATVSDEVVVPNWIWSLDGLIPRDARYEVVFTVNSNFGKPGAVLIKNEHPNAFILKTFHVETSDGARYSFKCDSWVYPPSNQIPRIFFRDKMFLLEETPSGIQELRKQELQVIQGNGLGQRETSDRIYDYDVYNDLGNPDDENLKRPVLGGSTGKVPYPRRNRTGRPPSKKDPLSESLPDGLDDMYIPVDEEFRKTKNSNFLGDAIKAFAHQLAPAIRSRLFNTGESYQSFEDVRHLYDRGVDLGKVVVPATEDIARKKITSPFTLINQLTDTDVTNNSLLKYPMPQVIKADRTAWMSDDEFARQTLAGLNPLVIKKLDSFPPKSILDPETYGPEASGLKAEHIEPQLDGLTVEQALEQDKLFTVDYHDVFLPYINNINALEGKKMYASRAIFFLTERGTLKTVALELSLQAPNGPGQRINKVYVPPKTTDEKWTWELAKAHFSVNDSGFHQLVSHWLRTHAAMEPFIIATNRQLSSIHPINYLLKPHFKNTMSINAKARKSLLNASGIIEDNFTPGSYSIELSAVAYDLLWRFDEQGLPGDLISRGIAKANPEAKHGLELAIPDYPYAVDGLSIWEAIKDWVTDYTNIFYRDDAHIVSDTELQNWWGEIINIGHGDKKDEDWWPKLDCKASLVEIVTTIIWIGSAHHAAVNFGQYAYAGFPPNRPTATHKLIPEEGSAEYKELLKDGEKYLMSAISSKAESTMILTTIEILSTHSEDEEYLGATRDCEWTSNQLVIEAYEKFSAAVKNIEEEILSRNKDLKLRNRRGPVEVDYTLLVPSSTPGITGRGVPNSISI